MSNMSYILRTDSNTSSELQIYYWHTLILYKHVMIFMIIWTKYEIKTNFESVEHPLGLLVHLQLQFDLKSNAN